MKYLIIRIPSGFCESYVSPKVTILPAVLDTGPLYVEENMGPVTLLMFFNFDGQSSNIDFKITIQDKKVIDV